MSNYEKNRKRIIEIQKAYRKNNLPFVKRQQSIWYIRTKEYIICTCGSKIVKHNINNHLKTKKHQGIIRKPRKTKQTEEPKIIPYKTIFVSKNMIRWNY